MSMVVVEVLPGCQCPSHRRNGSTVLFYNNVTSVHDSSPNGAQSISVLMRDKSRKCRVGRATS